MNKKRIITDVLAVSLTAGLGVLGLYMRAAPQPTNDAPVVLADLADQPSAPADQQIDLANVTPSATAPDPFNAPKPWHQDQNTTTTPEFASVEPVGDAPSNDPAPNGSFDIGTLAIPQSGDGTDLPDAGTSQSDVEIANLTPPAGLDAPDTSAADQLATAGLCNLNVTAQTLPTARVRLSIAAQCHPQSTVVITHASLRFKEQLDKSGQFTVIVPAFAEYARFDVELADGSRTSVSAFVPELAQLYRSGISWEGPAQLALQAQMPQSTVSANSPGSAAQARLFGGGYLETLGDADLPSPIRAEVFTAFAPQPGQSAFARMTLTLSGNCSDALRITSARSQPGMGAQQDQLTLTRDICAAGDPTPLLKNLVKDMRMARN